MSKLLYSDLSEVYDNYHAEAAAASVHSTLKNSAPGGDRDQRIRIPLPNELIEPTLYRDHDAAISVQDTFKDNDASKFSFSEFVPSVVREQRQLAAKPSDVHCENFMKHYRACAACQRRLMGVGKPSPEAIVERFSNSRANDVIHSNLLGDLNTVDVYLLIGFAVFTLYVIAVLKR